MKLYQLEKQPEWHDKLVEFDQFKKAAGTNAFVLPPQVWIEKTNAIKQMTIHSRQLLKEDNAK